MIQEANARHGQSGSALGPGIPFGQAPGEGGDLNHLSICHSVGRVQSSCSHEFGSFAWKGRAAPRGARLIDQAGKLQSGTLSARRSE